MMKRSFAHLLLALIPLPIVIGFNACSQRAFDLPLADAPFASPGATTGSLCKDELMARFETGYHLFLRNNCATCHDGSHEAPAFASTNLVRSFEIFTDKGYTLVSNNATSAMHNPPATGSQHISQIDELKNQWESAVNIYNGCAGVEEERPVITLGKADPRLLQNKATASFWATLNWDLQTEVTPESKPFPLKFSIEAQVARVNGTEVGYAFRNPKAQLTDISSAEKFRVKALFLRFNGQLAGTLTVYRNIDIIVCGGPALALMSTGNAGLLVSETRSASDQFAVQVSSIESVASSTPCGEVTNDPGLGGPTDVTFTQLTSTSPTLGVFRTHCASCHGATNPSAGLNLLNYNSAKAAATKILQRMNDSATPMPTSGILESDLRRAVEVWVNNGMPQ